MSVAVSSELPERHRKWQPYPAYKDSGVEWLRRIPVSWEAKRLKFVARLSYGDSLSAESREGGEVQVFGSNGPVGSHSYPNTLSPALIIGRKGSFGKVNFSDQPCFAIDTTYFIDARNTKENLRWLFYSLELLELDAISEDSAVPGLSREFAHEQWLPVPSLSEQGTIAAFLDRETAKIDALVAKKEQLIELLQEKRAAIISEAVTKGLDPNAQMKESGIEWLGKIPAHWEVAPLYARYEVALGKMLDTKRISGEYLAPYLRNVDVQWDSVNVDGLPEMDFALADRSRYALHVGDLLVCEGGEVGRTAMWAGELQECYYQKAVHRLRRIRNTDVSRFFYYVMYAGAKSGRFVAGGNPNTIDHLTAIQLKQYRFAFPPNEEQRAIAVFLDNETGKIGALIAKIREGIEKLKEYRTALISAAVTGKIDVSEEAATASQHLS